MNYEQKYKEALERAKKLQETCDSQAVVGWCEYIFSELKESEDEKIRKGIIRNLEYLADRAEGFVKDELEERIAWLEKQGENDSNKMPIWKHWKDGIAGNGEGKPIYLIKDGDTYRISSCLGFECDYIELSELDNLMLENQGEQKPEKKELEKIKNRPMLSDFFNAEYERGKADALQSVEWSEEDEKNLTQCIEAIDACYKWDSMIDWLKSLKNRYTWKPSEEQMKALQHYADQNNYDGAILTSLYNDLKQLKESFT